MSAAQLARVVGLPGSVLLGLGSILGTGVFVSIGVAAGVAGPMVVLAVPLAALVATFNGLSSAQLAAAYPVSGGTYEYGHRVLTPSLGFPAGFLFLRAKSASAATAALGFVLSALGRDPRLRPDRRREDRVVVQRAHRPRLYALTNLAAWRLPAERRRQPRWVAGGLVSCLLLAAFVELTIAAVGAGLLAIGFALRAVLRRRAAA